MLVTADQIRRGKPAPGRPSAATGTVMRASTLASYARDAGFARVEEAPVDDPFWRFHRLPAA